MAKIVSRMTYVAGVDWFGNVIAHGRSPLGDYMVTIQGRMYAVLPTYEQAEAIANQLVQMGR